MPFSTYLGRAPSEYGIVSSASKSPVEIRLTFSSSSDALAGWPGPTRCGTIWRLQRSWYLVRRAVSTENTGRQTSMTPTLIIALLPSATPASTPTVPAARNDAPRTVNQESTDRIVAPLPARLQAPLGRRLP